MTTDGTVAIITAYHPDQRLHSLVERALDECSRVIVVSNSPLDAAAHGAFSPNSRVQYVCQTHNVGLAGALNAGTAALDAECTAVLLLDQDSMLPVGLVRRLARALDDPSVGIAAPTPVNPDDGRPYQRERFTSQDFVERDAVITSGMLVSRSALTAAGPFREDFFVDWVDNDFCLRLRALGLRILQDPSLPLPHDIGQRQDARLGPVSVRVLRYPPWRHYWMVRNGVVLIRERLTDRPRWAFQVLLYLCRQALTAVTLDRGSASNAKAIVRGVVDGLRDVADERYLPADARYRPMMRTAGP